MVGSETGAPYEVVAVCGCGTSVLVCSTYPWLPPRGYRCNTCVHADEEAAARRGQFQLTQPVQPPAALAKPAQPEAAISEGAFSKRAKALGLLK